MRAFRDLPPNYRPYGELNLDNSRLLLVMNLLGLGLLVAAGGLFAMLINALRPHTGEFVWIVWGGNTISTIGQVVALVGLLLLMIVLHEGFHGLAFWFFTHDRPQFTFKGWYASASAPGWYFTLPAYALIGLLPLFGISLLGLAAVLLVPESWVVPLWAFMTINAAGAVGDLLMVGWVLRLPRGALVQDFHTRTVAYVPQSVPPTPEHVPSR
ncbi:DUF3267 domain-containing protein [uncultured Thermanaerothrix sp.]|uniref:DUF3267 domain-containing protein n=1 Tax=uncultured Thermanaerothrix sp. TaxID=1195149 RepID=UPI0026334231|nr:DUF3267 domain-containing protein [uncultured Thermanaerothrix sp.]